MRIPAKATITHPVRVDALPVQVVNGSVATVFGARFNGPDGVERSVAIPALWISHDAGFARAKVKTFKEEANDNAAKGLQGLARAEEVQGRVLRQGANRPEDLPPAASNARFVTASPDGFPSVDELDMQPFPENDSDEAVEKSGNYNICAKLPYMYSDSNLGEDRLKNGYTPSTVGYEPARYMGAVLVDSAGNSASGYLNSSGCTGNVYHTNGQYQIWVAAHMWRGGANDMVVTVYQDQEQKDAGTLSWFGASYSISGAGGTITRNLSGTGTIANLALASATTIYSQSDAFRGGSTDILADEPCPGDYAPPTACASGNTLYMNGEVWQKVVTAHELGHNAQRSLFGYLNNDYSIVSNVAVCRCDHVTGTNQLHCLQSREYVTTAQVEGYAQFFAADAFNYGSDENCTFAYYKEFLGTNGTVTPPPVVTACNISYLWLEHNCNGSDRGTEWDWMGFYWYLNNKAPAFSYADFEAVYENACGGTCSGNTLPWNSLTEAVRAEFGIGSEEYNDWTNDGDFYGVNH